MPGCPANCLLLPNKEVPHAVITGMYFASLVFSYFKLQTAFFLN